MKIIWKIGVCLLCGLALGVVLHGAKEKSGEEGKDENTTNSEEGAEELNASYNGKQSDLSMFATSQGVIEVADDKKDVPNAKSALKRWSTKQGVIEISGPDRRKKFNLDKLRTKEGIVEVSQEEDLERKKLKELVRQRQKDLQATSALRDKLRKKDVVQTTVTNVSNVERQVTLWGTGVPISPPLVIDVQDYKLATTVQAGNHPQAVIVNPFNNLIYVANQLSDSITVSTSDGAVVKTINLPASGLPGTNSPVGLVANTMLDSPGYGKVYVACSVADVICVIGTDLTLINTIPVGSRPMAIALNPLNRCLYIANMVSKSVTIINSVNELVTETLPFSDSPLTLSVNTRNGDIYVSFLDSEIVYVLNDNNNPAASPLHLQIKPTTAFWSSLQRRIYFASNVTAQIGIIEGDTYSISPPVNVGHGVSALLFNPLNRYLYLANRINDQITILNEDYSPRATVPAPGINNAIAIDSSTNTLIYNSKTSEFQVVGYSSESSSVNADSNTIAANLNFFRHNPAVIQHVKFVVIGPRPIDILFITESTIRGKEVRTPISLRGYESPQHFQRCYELDALKGSQLDGNTKWQFALPGFQSVSILIYYASLDREKILNTQIEKSNTIKSVNIKHTQNAQA